MTHMLLSTVQPVKASITCVRSQLNVPFTVLCSQKHESLCIDDCVNPGHNMVELLLNSTRQHFCTDYHAGVKFVIK